MSKRIWCKITIMKLNVNVETVKLFASYSACLTVDVFR
jgi:hypothetical protein